MIRSARATALLVLIAAATQTVGPAQAGWLDWSVSSDKAAKLETTAKPDPGQSQQTVMVERGDTLIEIAQKLQKAGVVLSADSFVNAASVDDRANSIGPGRYTLKKQKIGRAHV